MGPAWVLPPRKGRFVRDLPLDVALQGNRIYRRPWEGDAEGRLETTIRKASHHDLGQPGRDDLRPSMPRQRQGPISAQVVPGNVRR